MRDKFYVFTAETNHKIISSPEHKENFNQLSTSKASGPKTITNLEKIPINFGKLVVTKNMKKENLISTFIL